MVIDNTDTLQQKGLGEIVCDLCTAQGKPVFVSSSGTRERANLVTIPRDWARTLPPEEARVFGQHSMDLVTVFLSAEGREKHPSEVKRLLTSGMLPIWRIGECKETSLLQWERHLVKAKRKKWLGSWLREDSQPIPGIAID